MSTKRKVAVVFACICGVIAIILAMRWISSAWYASSKAEGEDPPITMAPAFPEGYVLSYDQGCAAYERKEYSEAESYFREAAQSGVSEPEDCDIRVNWALSICYQIDFDDLDTDMKKERAINRLHEASNILCENGCAVWGRQGEWHDDDAQQLEDDIEKMLSQLENGGGGDNQDQNENDEEKQKREQQKQQLQQQRRQAKEAGQAERQGWDDAGWGYGNKSW